MGGVQCWKAGDAWDANEPGAGSKDEAGRMPTEKNTRAELPEMATAMLASGPEGPAPEHMRASILQYAQYQGAGDVAGILSLFAPDAAIRDPANGPEHRGHEALEAFFRAGHAAAGGAIEMIPDGEIRIAGNHAAANFIVRTARSRPIYRVATTDVMTFGEDGLITSMIAYWGPENFQQES